MPSISTALVTAFAVSSFLVLYAYFLYPAGLWVVSRFVSRSTPTLAAADELPTVSLIIAAYNEEGVIADKIENSLGLDYPEDRLDIVVFSDASSDRTDEIVRSYADEGVELERIEGRVGKTECQNRVVDRVDGEILVFSDANCMYDDDAIRRLVARFGEGVDCVVGELRHTRTDDDVEGESLYWRYTRLVKRLESNVGSVVKGNGAIYAVRREAYVPLPADAMSDFAEPLAVRERGGRVEYAHDAVARERTAGSVEAERARKTRIATRSWHTVAQHLGLLNPLQYGRYSLQLFSDTVLWWTTPLLFVAAFASATALWFLTGSTFFGLVVAGFVALVLAGSVGHVLNRRGSSVPSLLHVPHYFLVGNYSLAVGAWNFLRGHNIVTWNTMNE
ncbi:glycosyltransferase family 2 protein (plasmid) [Halorussus salilacus]|uniref:glycosyltransferase family 2 protein n=1 Tax=Halorussus salilacus TaxID=2953750 RepID=UPI00209CC54F|nr:glycosyltransferase family 2 protein [Halorussus salilacus]USZ69746.1 glycosyltransferase family 2 protein [Halorussus salilacus]